MKHYILVQSIEICWLGWRSADLIFFARTDQTRPLPEPTGLTFSDPTGRPGLTTKYCIIGEEVALWLVKWQIFDQVL